MANAWTGTGESESPTGGFVELVEIPGGNQLVVLAPHGGKIEKLTTEQLAVVKTNLSEVCPRVGSGAGELGAAGLIGEPPSPPTPLPSSR